MSSNQSAPHDKLEPMVRRHLAQPERGPIAEHDRRAFDSLRERLHSESRPLVLDSFCGTGQSTALLAAKHPDHFVVGIDKSAARIDRHSAADAGNYLLLQADCGALWRQLLEQGYSAHAHYLLYPNPWPKRSQLQRRIHGHASFAWLLQLGGDIQLRTNWRIYADEFALAMQVAGRRGKISPLTSTAAPMTLFEAKYRHSGHQLWCYSSAAP